MNRSDHQSKTKVVTPSAREENVYMAKLSEQAQWYKEWNLLSVAYKNKIGTRRALWRIISLIEQKEEVRSIEDHVSMIRDYRSKIESELSNICDGILKLLDTRLISSAATGDSKVFYLKMKGEWAPAMDSEEWEILSIEREVSERIWD